MIGVKETIKNNIKKNISIKGMIEDAKESGKNQENSQISSSVSEGISTEEFFLRYRNLSIVIYISLICIIATVAIALTSGNFITWIICLLCTIIFGMFSLKYSFIAWRSRFIYKNWDLRHEPNEFMISDFFDEIRVNPMEIFPTKLKGSKNEE